MDTPLYSYSPIHLVSISYLGLFHFSRLKMIVSGQRSRIPFQIEGRTLSFLHYMMQLQLMLQCVLLFGPWGIKEWVWVLQSSILYRLVPVSPTLYLTPQDVGRETGNKSAFSMTVCTYILAFMGILKNTTHFVKVWNCASSKTAYSS